MSIDTTSDSRLNIKDLATNEPVKTTILYFDPERDISGTTWEGWVNDFNSRVKFEVTPSLIETAMYMNILFPDKRNALNIPSIIDLANVTPIGSPEIQYAQMRVLYPDSYESTSKNELESFEDYKKHIEKGELSDKAVWAAFVLYPERWSEIQGIPGLAESWRNEAEEVKNEGLLGFFAQYKVIEKILDPKKTVINQDEWEGMKNYLELAKDDLTGTAMAARMKILAADKIEMTERGLDISILKPVGELVGPKPQMPERRNF